MKKVLLGSALALSVFSVVLPQSAMAQQATVGSAGKGLNWLAKRINSIEVGTLANDMEIDGVTERSYVAVFSITGALMQNYELAGSDVGLRKVGREPGFQILPYTVSIASDGRKFISVAAIALKEMNKAYKNVGTTEHYHRNRGDKIQDEFWTVVNKIEALVYEYDEGLMINNTESHRLDFARIEAKLDILGSSKPGHFLALIGQAGAGLEYQKITTPNGVLMLSNEEGGIVEGRSFHLKTGAGLEYNLPIGKSNLNISGMFNWRKFDGFNYNRENEAVIEARNEANSNEINEFNDTLEAQYNSEVAVYDSAKEEYEVANFDGEVISDESYQELTGIAFPTLPDYREFKAEQYQAPRSSRVLMYVTPSIKFNGSLGGGTSYEVNVYGNIPLRDSFKGGNLDIDLSGTNARPILGAGLKVKF